MGGLPISISMLLVYLLIQVNEKSFELKRGNIGMVKKGRRQDWDGVVHNVCMVLKDSVCMHG